MEKSFEKSRSNFISRTMVTMGLGLLITFLVAIATANFIPIISLPIMVGAIITEFILVIYLGARISKMGVTQAKVAFYAYAAINGFTLSTIFVQYNLGFLSVVFLISSAMFVCSAMIGLTTKKDMTTLGQFFLMMLIGLLLLTVFKMIFNIPGLGFALSLVGIIIFCGLTAYDMQKVKMLHYNAYSIDAEEASKYSVVAALQLYLDFINIFLYVIRLFEER